MKATTYTCGRNDTMAWHLRRKWIISQCAADGAWTRIECPRKDCICGDAPGRNLHQKRVDARLERRHLGLGWEQHYVTVLMNQWNWNVFARKAGQTMEAMKRKMLFVRL